nr:uncharacterized protein LOC102461537 [Pelodiscus sinensis]|eukprot:XP_006118830.1 uncharacterized protein LOC102461537 [Pelodiscus sinensis]
MGSWGSKSNEQAAPSPPPIMTTASTTASTSPSTTASTSPSTTNIAMITEDKHIFDNPKFIYILVACILAVLLTMLVFTVIYLIRKRKDHNRPLKMSQEQRVTDTVHQAPAVNPQVSTCPEEITYASLIFK